MRSILFLSILVASFLAACTRFVQVPNPTTQIDQATVFSSDATATSAVMGIYSSMMQSTGMASVNTGLYAGLSADELISYSSDPGLNQFYSNSIDPSNPDLTTYWGNAYQYIYSANLVLEGLTANSLVSPAVKSQLTGEAKFIRAFCYFYLTNLFGDIPLILSSSYSQNAIASRTSRNLVYNQIIADLTDAENELSDSYLEGDNSPGVDRARPNKSAAGALLARVSLFLGNWTQAVNESSAVISNAQYSLVYNLDSVFLANSLESIWQLMPVYTPDNATWEGYVYILNAAPSGPLGVALSNGLVNGFEPGDLRRIYWIDSIQVNGFNYYYAFKYKLSTSPVLTEYYTVLRLSEQYLIRAEAEAMTGDLVDAATDLNRIRNKAGLANTSATDMSSLLRAIQTERRFELFTEWGHRWLDLKRTGTANAVLAPIKAPGWAAYDTLYPIPKTEIQNDPNLTQNPSY